MIFLATPLHEVNSVHFRILLEKVTKHIVCKSSNPWKRKEIFFYCHEYMRVSFVMMRNSWLGIRRGNLRVTGHVCGLKPKQTLRFMFVWRENKTEMTLGKNFFFSGREISSTTCFADRRWTWNIISPLIKVLMRWVTTDMSTSQHFESVSPWERNFLPRRKGVGKEDRRWKTWRLFRKPYVIEETLLGDFEKIPFEKMTWKTLVWFWEMFKFRGLEIYLKREMFLVISYGNSY